jgi:hypothetical protein
MKTKAHDPAEIVDRLRTAIINDGRTHYAIAKDAGIEPDILDRFQTGRDIYLTTAAKIAIALGVDLIASPRKRKRVS